MKHQALGTTSQDVYKRQIKYYMALSALKKMLADGVITSENYNKATVAIAERYRVLRYDI